MPFSTRAQVRRFIIISALFFKIVLNVFAYISNFAAISFLGILDSFTLLIISNFVYCVITYCFRYGEFTKNLNKGKLALDTNHCDVCELNSEEKKRTLKTKLN